MPSGESSAAITPELFAQWRSPRFGTSNPERFNNPVWEWLIKSRLSAYSANEKFAGPDSMDSGPCWCFNRYGQSSTSLPDGRIVLIGGEHEDYYDADFCIYNDVVIKQPDGRIEILGYPRDIFPPTDFHTATLVGKKIIIIGSLGYPDDRKPGVIPVFVLNLDNFAISRVTTTGNAPGWIHDHSASLSNEEDSILIKKGKACRDKGLSFVENIDDWRLHLADWRWEKLTERKWLQLEFRRKDGKRNHLWEIEQARWYDEVSWTRECNEEITRLVQELRTRPNLNLAATLYHPNIPHETLPNDKDEHRVFRIKVDGVTVRYVEEEWFVQVIVEGNLPQQTVDLLITDLQEKLIALENALFDVKQL